MSNTRRTPRIAPTLIKNSQAALLAAIEIHNKPVMVYRYPLCVLLVVNAWELALKAYIHKKVKGVKLIDKSGHSKPFEKCLEIVNSHIGSPFAATKESLERLYDYRNQIAHFHCQPLDEIVYSLLRANILFFCEFIETHFEKTIAAPDNFVLLPLGFSHSLGPIHYLTHKADGPPLVPEVQEFLHSITRSIRHLHEEGVEDSILAEFTVHLVSAKRAKNADIVAKLDSEDEDATPLQINQFIEDFRLSNSPEAKEVRLADFNERFNKFSLSYTELTKQAKERYSDFIQDQTFRTLMRQWKQDPNCCQVSYLDPVKREGTTKLFFGGRIWEVMGKHYILREKWEAVPENS